MLIKYPRLLMRSDSCGLTPFEFMVVSRICSTLDNDIRKRLERQAAGVNFVDRGPVIGGYSSLFARVQGVRIVCLAEVLLDEWREHVLGACSLAIDGEPCRASLRCTEGEIASLDFDLDVSDVQRLSRNELSERVRFT
jgi:hypothetical protein